MNTTIDTATETIFKMLVSVVAEKDQIHPAHAENRLRAAWKLLQEIPDGTLINFMSTGSRQQAAARAEVKVDPDSPTWEWVVALALL